MNLYIAFTGLFLILQPNDNGPVEILFLDSTSRQVTFRSHTLDLGEHRLAVLPTALSDPLIRLDLPQRPDMTIGQLVDDTHVEMHRNAGFLEFSEIYDESCMPQLRPECTGPWALDRCREFGSHGRPVLSGRFRLEGGRLEPMEISDEAFITEDPQQTLAQPTVDSAFQVRPPEEEPWIVCPASEPNCENPPYEQTTFNGALYTRELAPDTKWVDVWIGDQRLSIPVKNQDACKAIGSHPADQPCGYLLISNSFQNTAHGAGTAKGVDFHFGLNYEVFLPLPSQCDRMIPVWKYYEGDQGPEPGGGTRCIPPKYS